MNAQEYALAAKQTESVVESIQLNPLMFNTFATLAIKSIEILDAIKKNAFYGKPIDTKATIENVKAIQQLVNDQFVAILNDVSRNGVKTRPIPGLDTRVTHSLLGVVTESGELLETLQAYVNSGSLDGVNLGEEFGDVDWYKAIGLDALGLTQEQVWDTNIEKLHRKRYKSGKFTADEAINRDVVVERQALEESLQPTLNTETEPTAPVVSETVPEPTPPVVNETPVVEQVATPPVKEPAPTTPTEPEKIPEKVAEPAPKGTKRSYANRASKK